jgi:site-specific DNA recombinase
MSSILPQKLVYGYTRVSTDMQVKEGASLEAQYAEILKYCNYNNISLGKVFCDEGLSGGTLDRPELTKMLGELRPGIVVVCKNLSRLSRSVKQFQEIFETIMSKGAHLVLLDMGVDTTTGIGKLLLVISSGLAEFERNQISERTSSVMQNMSRTKTLKTKPKYGYMYNESKQLVENPEEQQVIDLIRKMISEDPTISDTLICRKLQEAGIQKLRKSKRIYPNIINNIILYNKLRG